MRILHAITALPKAAGTTIFCVRLAEEQAKLGHAVIVVVKAFIPDRDVLPQGCSFLVWKPGEALPFEPDIVHNHTPWTWWSHQIHVWTRKRGILLVQSTHGSYSPWAMAHKRWKKFLPWYCYQKNDLARAVLLHATAYLETEQLRALGFTNPIVEVPLGTDLPQRMADFTNPEKVLLFVGRIYPVKGLDLLIRAWGQIDTTGWKLRLVGPDQEEYLQTLRGLCRSPNVEFVGSLYGVDLERAYLSSRALVLPSYTENFGGVVVDALSYGIPVLTSENTPWNFLQERGSGWHFPTEVNMLVARLKRLISTSDEELMVMGRRGRRIVETDYVWSELAKRMCTAYQSERTH